MDYEWGKVRSQNPTYPGGMIPMWLEEGLGVCSQQDAQWRQTDSEQARMQAEAQRAMREMHQRGGVAQYGSARATR